MVTVFFHSVIRMNPAINPSLTVTQTLRIIASPLIAYFCQIYIFHQPSGDEPLELAKIEEQILYALMQESK